MIQTQFLGHASLRFAGPRGALICDPWLANVPIYGNTAVKYPFVPAEEIAHGLDASHIYISHHHEDHFHVPTLDLFRRDIHILVPAFEYVSHPRGASMLRTLERMGFTRVQTLKSWESIEIDLGEPLNLTLIPSAQSRWHDWENSGLIYQAAGWTALNLNDNLVDAKLLDEIERRAGRPDVVYVQGFPSTEFPGAFDFTVQQKIAIGRQKRGNVDQADMVIRRLRPRAVVPIACDIAWHREQDLYRNYSDKPTPSRFGPILESRGLLAQTRYIELAPGDSLDNATLETQRPYGTLNYAGFRRRLRKKMARYAPLVHDYDAYTARRGFKPADLEALLPALRDYFPVRFPSPDPATVRLDFVIVGADAHELARLVFCVRDNVLSIDTTPPPDLECDQEIIVPESVWLECADGALLRRDLLSLCVNRQLRPFKPAVAGLRYFTSYYLDRGDISPWMRISNNAGNEQSMARMRAMRATLAPQFPASFLRDEYLPASAGA